MLKSSLLQCYGCLYKALYHQTASPLWNAQNEGVVIKHRLGLPFLSWAKFCKGERKQILQVSEWMLSGGSPRLWTWPGQVLLSSHNLEQLKKSYNACHAHISGWAVESCWHTIHLLSPSYLFPPCPPPQHSGMPLHSCRYSGLQTFLVPLAQSTEKGLWSRTGAQTLKTGDRHAVWTQGRMTL